jgi:hypothetical protein
MNIIEKYWVSAHLRMNNDLNASNVSNVETSSSFFFLDKKEAKNQGCRKIG